MKSLKKARDLERSYGSRDDSDWLELERFRGRLSEISGTRSSWATTLAANVVAQAQREGEPTAWICSRDTLFFPPDMATHGVALNMLPVVRTPDAESGARATATLLHSGFFGLVIVDLGDQDRISAALQGKLAQLSRKHEAAVVFVTAKDRETGSLGSMIAYRIEASRLGASDNRFMCRARVLKDKTRGPGREFRKVYHGPPGMC